MNKINVAVVGVGSFAKALVEGVSFYAKNPDDVVGLMCPAVGGYRIGDINFVAAFDVDERKVGKKLHEAIRAEPNVTKKITDPVQYDATVYRGPTLDGVIQEMRGTLVRESSAQAEDVASVLKKSRADVVVNLVPSGADQATFMYASAALDAGCSFVNCIPTALATIPEWQKRFEKKGLVLLGDDIKSQLGATMLNRALLSLLKMRGIKVVKSEQENIGGNTDHYNLLYRAHTKEKSKREALENCLEKQDATPGVKFRYIGEPSGHKTVNLNIEGEIFGHAPISITASIEDEISINGAGTLVDAIRVTKFLLDTGRQKEASKACPFLMKSPPRPMSDAQAFATFQELLVPADSVV